MSAATATLRQRRASLPTVSRLRQALRSRARRGYFVPGPLMVIGALWLVVAFFLFRSR